LKRTLSSIAAAALVLGTLAPAAFADTSAGTYSDVTTGGYGSTAINDLTAKSFIHGFSDGTYKPGYIVSRGQLLAYMMNALGLKAQANAQYYADVAPGNWAFNYVGAAQENGWINPYWIGVKPGYNFNENNQASMGDAASFFVAAMENAGKISKTDLNGMSPLAYAKSIGLFNGVDATQNTLATYTGGTDTVAQQSVYLDRASAAIVLENIVAWNNGQLLPAGATVSVSASNPSLAPNSNEKLSVVVKNTDGTTYTLPSTATVSYSVDNANGFVNQASGSQSAQLVVTSNGTYNVTATVDGTTSAPYAVNVYGNMASVKLTAANASPIANSVASDTVTATAVDANGNTVGNFNGTAVVTLTGTAVTAATGTAQAGDVTVNGNNTYTLTFTNGVATMNVISGSTPGLSSSINAVYTATGATSTSTATLALTTAQQVATGLQVTSNNKFVSANTSQSTQFSVTVVDQTGNPMLTGAYSYNVNLTGSGSLDGAPTTGVFVGSQTPNPINVYSVQGQTGAISLTASATGLQSGTASVQSVIAGVSSKLAATPVSGDTTSFAESANTILTLGAVDANGYPAVYPSGGFIAYVTDASGATATNIKINGAAVSTAGVLVPAWSVGSPNPSLTFSDTMGGADAGTYTVTVKDSSGNVWSTFTLTETAGAASKLSVSSAASQVGESAPTTTVTAQLQDAYGNNVATSGVPVVVYAQGSLAGTATLNNQAAVSPATEITVDTDSNGAATATLNVQPYANEVYTVTSSSTGLSTGTATVTVEPTVATNVSVVLQGTNSGASIVAAGQQVTGTVYFKDQYGNPVTSAQSATLTFSGSGSLTGVTGNGISGSGPYTISSTGGAVTFTGTAQTSGLVTATVTDSSVYPNASGSGSISVSTGTTLGGYGFFNAQGQEITSANQLAVTANTPVEVWLKPVDSQGNPLVSAQAGSVSFGDGSNGQFRINSEFSANSTTDMVPAGSAAIAVWYVNGTTGSYTLSATAPVTGITPGTFNAAGTVTGSVYSYSTQVTLNGPGGSTTAAPTSLFTLSLGSTSYAMANTQASGTFNVAQVGSGYTITFYNTAASEAGSTATLGYNGVASTNVSFK